jgi:tRNA dimethylallyltransferase
MNDASVSEVLPRIVCIVGPTSSGKTDLSLRAARLFCGEIVNADARQCYRNVNIGTGKPSGVHRQLEGEEIFEVEGVPHHLMDIIPPTEIVTAAWWRERALKAIHAIRHRDHLPIIVGGTGLYLQGLIDNLSFYPSPNTELRASLQAKTLSDLVQELRLHDPAAADRVDLHNPRRVIRALEIVLTSGDFDHNSERRGPPLVEAFQVGIRWPREMLVQRINRMVVRMFEEGWVEEVQTLLRSGVSAQAPAMNSIGYPLIIRHLQGELSRDETIRLCQQAVRRYAKRQETWFRRDPRIHWFEDPEEALTAIRVWLHP